MRWLEKEGGPMPGGGRGTRAGVARTERKAGCMERELDETTLRRLLAGRGNPSPPRTQHPSSASGQEGRKA